MIYEVYKKFEADPGLMVPGDLVETTGWPNEQVLIRSGFIGPSRKPESELKKAKILEDGRVVFARNVDTDAVQRPAVEKESKAVIKKKRGRPRKTKVPPKDQEE